MPSFPRAPWINLYDFSERIIRNASVRVTGANVYWISLRISTKIPPKPHVMIWPNPGSFFTPISTSSPRSIWQTSTPAAFFIPINRLKFSLTASRVTTSSTTPPTSDLCAGPTTFITNGKPNSCAAFIASSSVEMNLFLGRLTPIRSNNSNPTWLSISPFLSFNKALIFFSFFSFPVSFSSTGATYRLSFSSALPNTNSSSKNTPPSSTN